MATATQSLTRAYGSFFSSAIEIACSPYTITYNAFAGKNKNQQNPVLGIIGCVFLSTVVPILPEISSLTFAIAAMMVSLAITSMFLSYPVSLVIDAFDCFEPSQGNAYAPV